MIQRSQNRAKYILQIHSLNGTGAINPENVWTICVSYFQ